MKAKLTPYIRPLVVLAGAGGFLALFLNGYVDAGGNPQTWPIVIAAGGIAVIAAGLIALIAYAQHEARRVRRVVQPEPEPEQVGAAR